MCRNLSRGIRLPANLIISFYTLIINYAFVLQLFLLFNQYFTRNEGICCYLKFFLLINKINFTQIIDLWSNNGKNTKWRYLFINLIYRLKTQQTEGLIGLNRQIEQKSILLNNQTHEPSSRLIIKVTHFTVQYQESLWMFNKSSHHMQSQISVFD